MKMRFSSQTVALLMQGSNVAQLGFEYIFLLHMVVAEGVRLSFALPMSLPKACNW